MGVADRVDEIERLIAENEMTSSQVFTQMKQLMLYTRSDINKLKADAVREFSDALCHSLKYDAEGLRDIDAIEQFIDDFTAEKLERGKL